MLHEQQLSDFLTINCDSRKMTYILSWSGWRFSKAIVQMSKSVARAVTDMVGTFLFKIVLKRFFVFGGGILVFVFVCFLFCILISFCIVLNVCVYHLLLLVFAPLPFGWQFTDDFWLNGKNGFCENNKSKACDSRCFSHMSQSNGCSPFVLSNT